jgi:hypothetical protein
MGEAASACGSWNQLCAFKSGIMISAKAHVMSREETRGFQKCMISILSLYRGDTNFSENKHHQIMSCTNITLITSLTGKRLQPGSIDLTIEV